MRRRHVCKLVQRYKRELDRRAVVPKTADLEARFSQLSTDQLLGHCRDTLDAIEYFTENRWRYWWNYGVCLRKLGAVQAALSFAGVYTLQEIRAHNSAAPRGGARSYTDTTKRPHRGARSVCDGK